MYSPPARSTGLLTDLRYFLLQRPKIPTRVEFRTAAKRNEYQDRILQRLGIDVAEYSVLNIHKIGINAPVVHVFGELLGWNGDATCWPNHIAQVELADGRLEHIDIFLFGIHKCLGLKFMPLFNLKLRRIQTQPAPSEVDNARFLLFESTGGYPIGFFTLYARSPIATEGEENRTQFFMVVGFNFYGMESRPRVGVVDGVWESIHNRVTSNIMNRFKQLCEWKFRRLQEGGYTASAARVREADGGCKGQASPSTFLSPMSPTGHCD